MGATAYVCWIAASSISIWLLLRVLFPKRGVTIVFAGALLGAVLNTAYLIWEDAQQRFCCNPHSIVDWFEVEDLLWLAALTAIGFLANFIFYRCLNRLAR